MKPYISSDGRFTPKHKRRGVIYGHNATLHFRDGQSEPIMIYDSAANPDEPVLETFRVFAFGIRFSHVTTLSVAGAVTGPALLPLPKGDPGQN